MEKRKGVLLRQVSQRVVVRGVEDVEGNTNLTTRYLHGHQSQRAFRLCACRDELGADEFLDDCGSTSSTFNWAMFP